MEVVLEPDGLESRGIPLQPDGAGYFRALVPDANAGSLYAFKLDGEEKLYPDPASRFQPAGPHRSSQVIDPTGFPWSDADWPGVSLEGQVVYEVHIGTFTPEGTWAAATRELSALAELGITVIEMMPVAEFPGRFGWGYDGVDLFAPSHLYGNPDDLRRFVDESHRLGIAVVLDVVYNHLGPDGNYLAHFSPAYFTDRYNNEWGDAINFDGPDSAPVREFFLANARYWIDEFHMDGLRLDATQQIFDASTESIITAIGQQVRRTGHPRRALLLAENEPQRARLVRPPELGGSGLDALWSDDFHHSALVAVTGHREAYYSDFLGTPQELISAVKHGFLFQGQRSAWQKNRRGSPALDLDPAHFVVYLQNHDQVANSATGARLHEQTTPGRYRAITALWLLAPMTPMFFQGQEFAASSPFLYFADHKGDLAASVREGRRKFMRQFPSAAVPEVQASLCDPDDESTFARSKLDPAERGTHRAAYSLHRDLLRLRRNDPVFQRQRRGSVDGAVLTPESFILRFFSESGDDRLLWVNLGRDLRLGPAAEPLLAPPEGSEWSLLWSSEDRRYGGAGTPKPETDSGWLIPAHAALVFAPRAVSLSEAGG